MNPDTSATATATATSATAIECGRAQATGGGYNRAARALGGSHHQSAIAHDTFASTGPVADAARLYQIDPGGDQHHAAGHRPRERVAEQTP